MFIPVYRYFGFPFVVNKLLTGCCQFRNTKKYFSLNFNLFALRIQDNSFDDLWNYALLVQQCYISSLYMYCLDLECGEKKEDE